MGIDQPVRHTEVVPETDPPAYQPETNPAQEPVKEPTPA